MQVVPMDTQKSKYDFKHFLRDVTIGTVATTSYVACRAFKEENRADTFVKTAKNCLKDYTNYNRNQYCELAKMLKLNDLANWINKIGNKKMCAALFAGGAVLEGLFIGSIWDWVTKK